MKLIGIDYGTKRVGIAVSDDAGKMAFPRAILRNDKNLIPELKALIEKERAEGIVVGESKNLSGEDNAVMAAIKSFAETLQLSCGVPIYFEPEFYSSKEARQLSEDVHKRNKKEYVDARAAAIILNSYLARSAL